MIDPTKATITSMYTGDASIRVSRVSSGVGQSLGGTWYLTLDGEASKRIPANASADEVTAAIANLTGAGNISVAVDHEGPNGGRSWVITFLDWNDPSRRDGAPILTLSTDGLVGIEPSGLLMANKRTTGSGNEFGTPEFCAKAVLHLSSMLSSGNIDDCSFVATWLEDANYALPAFSSNANSSALESALAKVDRNILGQVWVSREEDDDPAAAAWNITFIENVKGRVPSLTCGSDATVSWVEHASCEAIGGEFSLTFAGNATEKLPFNASEFEVSFLGICIRDTIVPPHVFPSLF